MTLAAPSAWFRPGADTSGQGWVPTSTATSDDLKLSPSNLPLIERAFHKQWLIPVAGDHVVLDPRAPKRTLVVNQCSQSQQRPPYKEATGVAAPFSAQPLF